jgi:hypothetical protein
MYVFKRVVLFVFSWRETNTPRMSTNDAIAKGLEQIKEATIARKRGVEMEFKRKADAIDLECECRKNELKVEMLKKMQTIDEEMDKEKDTFIGLCESRAHQEP